MAAGAAAATGAGGTSPAVGGASPAVGAPPPLPGDWMGTSVGATAAKRRRADGGGDPAAPGGGTAGGAGLLPTLASPYKLLPSPYKSLLPGAKGPRAHRIVVTGGPCAGKSTGIARMREVLEANGVNVFCVPEAATLLFDGGARAVFGCGGGDAAVLAFQRTVLRTQVALEDAFVAIATACGKEAVVLCDRGTMDGRYFCPDAQWAQLVEGEGTTTAELRDGRYDIVVHLVTAAEGAEQHYRQDAHRTETAAEARAQCLKLKALYLGHPRQLVIDNSTPFAEKIGRAVAPILELVGARRRPAPYLRYLVETPPPRPFPCDCADATVDIWILLGSTNACAARLLRRRPARGAPGAATSDADILSVDPQGASYLHQLLRQDDDGRPLRVERRLTARAFTSLLGLADPRHERIEKRCTSFLWADRHYELATFLLPESRRGQAMLYVEHPEESGRPPLPLFITESGRVEEVTAEGWATSFALSRRPGAATSPTGSPDGAGRGGGSGGGGGGAADG